MHEQLALLSPDGAEISELTKPVRVLGIDLGTTNSAMAEISWPADSAAKLEPRCIEVPQKTLAGTYTHFLVPSAVALYNGREWVGEGAKRLHARSPEFGLDLNKNLFLECKNDMGARRTYHRAPEGYRTAAEIGARVLSFLKQEAEQINGTPISRTVVTVPASFQAAQRMDTIKAVRLAGIPVAPGDLLDEPVAAFLDFLLTHTHELNDALSEKQNLLVFDFGGGTCDVAIFKLAKAEKSSSLQISPLSVSRYHRLGGGDIDRAILYEVLLPQLLEQNNITRHDLSFEDKKKYIEPALLGVAEALKIGLCKEVTRLQGLGRYDGEDKEGIVKMQPGLHRCTVNKRVLQLQSPSLSVAQFEEILAPFLDTELLYARETEYRLTCSIFAPIQDALERSGLEASDIHLCLPVGGSSLIPQVKSAMGAFFNNARLLSFSDHDAVLVAVARGAAYHALALEAFGRSIFEIVTPDRLSIQTAQGAYELIPKGTPLPYPAPGEWAETSDLIIPETSLLEPVPLSIEIIAGEEQEARRLFNALWDVPGPVNKGDRLRLQYRLDENQVFTFKLTLEDRNADEPFEGHIENPLTNVVNPNATWLKIHEAEEALRKGEVPHDEVPDKVVELARDYAKLHQLERAIDYLKRVLRMRNEPDAYVLNLMGIYYGEIEDFEKQERCYREAAQAGGGSASLFNLALSQHQQKKYREAQTTIMERLDKKSDGAGLTLAAQIAEALGESQRSEDFLAEALAAFGPIRSLDDWELGWLTVAARMANNETLRASAQAEQRRRQSHGRTVEMKDGVLPEIIGGLRRI